MTKIDLKIRFSIPKLGQDMLLTIKIVYCK